MARRSFKEKGVFVKKVNQKVVLIKHTFFLFRCDACLRGVLAIPGQRRVCLMASSTRSFGTWLMPWAQPAGSDHKITLLGERPDQSISREVPMATVSVALQMPESVIVHTCVSLGPLPHSGPEPATVGILFYHLGHQAQLEIILILWFMFAFLTIAQWSPCSALCVWDNHRRSAES